MLALIAQLWQTGYRVSVSLPSAAAVSSASKQAQDVLLSKETTSDNDQEMDEEMQGEKSPEEDMDQGDKPLADKVATSESGSSASSSEVEGDFSGEEYDPTQEKEAGEDNLDL